MKSPDQEQNVALLLTDLVDSAALAEQLGDAAMNAIWAAHDRMARDLLRQWRGREIDKTDGFLLLFADVADALAYALAYHRALAELPVPAPARTDQPVPKLRARAGLHVGQVTMRETPAADVALGAKPFEADGVSKPIAARVMSTALGGQTLLTPPAIEALRDSGRLNHRAVSHGHWHVKGLPLPLELTEVGEADAPFTPPPDSAKVYRVFKQGDLWLPLRELRHTLPAERDAFVGRRTMLQDLAARFDDGARLVSILGIGGGGKTRLATRFGWGWMGEFPGGVWFCDLTPARTLEGLASAVAQGLEVPLGQEDAVVQLGNVIAGRGQCLVILDNFEQLARHAEDTIGHWLDRAPEASFIVTTREVLGIPGEETLALAPLPTAEAQQLFNRRAAAAKRDFKPGADDEAAIATLVKLLDGLPLAIELAAARVRTLAPHALLARMSERFKLLASSGGRQDRQATLRAAFDWSWDLLPTAEKLALAQLSVFEGGFNLEAAEAVIDLSALADPPWTLDVVNALVDKSFVRPLGDDRFDLLVSVQAYADDHLRNPGRYTGSGPEAVTAAHARHGAWFASLGPERATEHACADLDNLVVACRRAVAVGHSQQAAGALDGAWAALSLQGPFQVGVELSEAVCGMADLAGADAAHAHAVRGLALESVGQRARAGGHFQQALTHARKAADEACEAQVTVRLGWVQARSGHAEAARELHNRALLLARRLGNGNLECASLTALGHVDFEQGRLHWAREQWEEALAVARRTGNRRSQGSLLSNLTSVFATLELPEQASESCRAALQIAREHGDRTLQSNALSNLGMLQYLQGRLQDAASTLTQGLGVARDVGYVRSECDMLVNLGMVLAQSNLLLEAVERCTAALRLARLMGDARMEGISLGHLGLVLARQHDYAGAQSHLEQAEALVQPLGDISSLGLILCHRAELEWLRGNSTAAQATATKASRLAASSNAGAGSELGQALVRLHSLVAA